MATVFLAEDERLGRKVAIKRLHADSPDDAARRFQREAKVGASLSHPNIVTMFDTVADDEGVLIVMEYVEGETLTKLMSRGPVPTDEALSIIGQVAAALDHVHSTGVVHRDVKPANILVTPGGRAKLVDLGIAIASERTQITAVGTVLGTPSYMAPEQLDGAHVTQAADVYALGAVAYELLSGAKARGGRTPVEIAHQIATLPAPDIRDAWAGAPPEAAQLLQTAMDRDPARRPQSAGALARGLESALRAPRRPAPRLTPTVRDDAPPTRLTTVRRRRLPGWIPAAGIVAILLVAAGAIAALSSGGTDKGIVPAIQTKTAKKATKKPHHPSTQRAPATQSSPTTATSGSGDPAAMQAQAHALIAQGQYTQAIALDRQVVAQGPGSGLTYAYALFDLGHALRLSGQPAAAIPVLEQRLKIDNQRAVVQAELDQARAAAGGGPAASGGGDSQGGGD